MKSIIVHWYAVIIGLHYITIHNITLHYMGLHYRSLICSDNGISNGLEIFTTPQHGPQIVASNNDQAVRVYQVQPSGLRCG